LVARHDQACVQRIDAITQRFESLCGAVELVPLPTQIARGKRDLRLGDLATGLGEAFVSAEAARGAAQELARPVVVAELSHRNAAHGERRRIFAQRHALERTKRITSRQQARSRGDKRIHGGRLLWPLRG
jgi:hypothetical protein